VKKLVFLFAFVLVGVASAAPSVVSTTQTAATVEGLECGSKYRLEIRKYAENGELSSTAEYVDAQTKSCPDTQAPSAPPGLAVTGASENSISLSWSASTDNVGVAGYHLYRGGTKVDSTSATSYSFGGLACGTSYTLAVEAEDAAGNRSPHSAITASTAACPPPSCASGAYSAHYYGNMTLSGTPLLQRCESALDHGWGSGSPAGVPADRFSARWTGTHSFAAGTYQFTATADDGLRLWVDGALVIDAWKEQAPTTYQATRTLTAGEHALKVEYYENGGGAVARVGWQLNQLPPPPPPPSSCPIGDYLAQYYGTMTLSGTAVLQRCERSVNYDWGGGSPAAGVPADRFSTRWTGTFSFAAGSHQFTATADDGIRVWLDGTLVIDAWKEQAPTSYQATRTLTAGEHALKVEYYENGGGAVARLSWQLSQLPAPPLLPAPASDKPLGFSTGCCITGNANRVRMLDEAATAGIARIRDEIWWTEVEPTNGSFNWTKYVSFVNLAKTKGIEVLYILQNTPAWANGGQSYKVPPTNPADFGDFCGQAAKTLGPLGVRAFEVWNEANLQDFFHPRPDAAKYVALLKACYDAIKAVDPTIMVISSGLSPYGGIGAEAANGTVNPVTFLQRMYENGAAGHFDALGWHPYSSEGATFFSWSGWSQMSETNPSARSLMIAKGDGAKKIWATEAGNRLSWCGGSETCQAERTRVQLEKWKAFDWAGPIYFYNQWAGLADADYSAARVDWSKRPVWNVLATY
jgi:chitodextrinase